MHNNYILYSLMLFFIILGVVMPYVNEGFSHNSPTHDPNSLITDATGQTLDETGMFDVLLSVVSMFLWTFGSIPVMIDAIIFIPLRVMFYIVLYDKIRGMN